MADTSPGALAPTNPPAHTGLVPFGGGSLVPRDEVNAQANAMVAASIAEVRLALEMAVNFPRNEDDARSRIMSFCKRPAFADKALYSFPRGRSQVMGPSIVLAQEIGKAWRNMRWGFSVIADQGPHRTVRGWAWDLENNIKKEIDLTFEKLIYRKDKGWVEPDERDLLELTNRNGSKAARNALLGLLPWDLLQDAIGLCLEVQKQADKSDPDRARKAMLLKFATDLGVNGAELTAYVGYPLEQLHEADLAELRAVYNACREGELTWQEAVKRRAAEVGVEGHVAPSTATEMRKRVKEKAERQAQEAAHKKGAT